MRHINLIAIINLWLMPVVVGQQIWPGDINNNGVVNNIDVLYWAIAEGAMGTARDVTSSEWQGQDLPTSLWERSFPGGLNFAYADCDGDGDVDDDDKTVIEENFGQIHGIVVPDDYATGNPLVDPILLLSAEQTTIAPGDTLKAGLSLGAEDKPLTDFYGIAFTVVYDPDFVWNLGSPVRLLVFEDSWINGGGQGNERVIQFFKNEPESGVAYFALVRKNKQEVSGFGDIGEISIVMEDIVFGYSNIGITEIRTIDLELEAFPVAPSGLTFSVEERITTASQEQAAPSGVKVYPNPTAGSELNIEMVDPQAVIRHAQLFDLDGRQLSDFSNNTGGNILRINMGSFPSGVYTIKIYSDRGVYIRSFVQKNR